jgi:PAS domain S-box-containing protein
MGGRARVAVIGLVLVLASVGVGGLTVVRLYREGFEQQRQRLIEVAQSRARLIEAVARFDSIHSSDYPGGPDEATLSQLRDAHGRFPGFGETGEYTLARLEEERIVFLLRHRAGSGADVPEVDVASGLAQPMRRALAGESGTMVGVDYAGKSVLAAYEPVDVLRLGLVTKIDMAEVRAPYMRAGRVVALGGAVLVLLGLVGVQTLGGGLVERLEELEEGERRTLEQIQLLRRIGRVGTLEVDVSGSRVVLGPDLCRLMGETPAELVMSPAEFFERVHPDDRHEMVRQLDETRRGEAPSIDRACRLRKAADGGYLSVVAAIQPVAWDESGGPTRLLGTVADVTALEEARDMLFAREAHLRAAQEMGRIGSWEWSRHDGAMWWSDELYRLLGSAPGEVPATAQTFLARVHPDDLDAAGGGIDEILERDRPVEATFRIVVGDDVRWMRGAARPHLDARGVPGRMIGFLQDVNEAHAMADMLRHAQKMETLGMLSGGIAHDFNNLLTAIQANVDLMREDLPPEAGGLAEGLQEIRTASRLGVDMVRKLMSFSRSNLENVRVVDVGQILADTRSLLVRLLPATVRLHLDTGHGPLRCRVDRAAFQEILLNLVTNARDAMAGRGDLTIETHAEDTDEGARVLIRVRDTGVGIDPEKMSRVFEPFYTSKGEGRGTGLGLAMVHALMKKQGGRVSVDSEPGQGTTFTLAFPAVDAAVEVAAEREGGARERLRGKERILLVEDEPAIRRAGETILRRFGYEVTAVADGEDALAALLDVEPPDLVVSDVMLPRISGIELYERTRRMAAPPRFLLMSGYGATELAQAGGVQPGLRFLRKPWGVEELLRAVRAALDGPVGEEHQVV